MSPGKEEVVQFLDSVWKDLGNQFAAILHTDNGSEFVNKDVKAWCRRRGVEHAKGLPYHPQSQGQVQFFYLY